MIKKEERGYLMLIAAFLIIIGGFISITVSNIINTSARATSHHLDTSQAFYIANAGLNRAVYALSTDDFSDRISCAAITGNNNFTNINFGQGQYTVTGTAVSASSSTLTTAITNTAPIIPLSSLTNYANSGRVLIDAEVIDYLNTSTDANVCGTAPCLTNATRAAAGTTAVAHSIGSPIVQSRCSVEATGYVPDTNNPTGTRAVTTDVFDLVQGWLIGNTNGGNENIMQLDGNSWTQVSPSMDIPNVHLYGMEMLNYADGWAVGQSDSGKATLLQWDGSSWSRVLPENGTPNKDLTDIACVSANDCWAVGDAKTFLHWNGSLWTSGNVESSFPNKQINGIACTASDNCWAVGQSHSSDVIIGQWNGSQWTRVLPDSSVPNSTLDDITCLSSTECWAVGSGSAFILWDGSTWSKVNPDASVPNKQIHSISCTSSNNCWAVGSPQGSDSLIVRWNGTTWSRFYPDATVPNSNLNSVSCSNADNCWATGGSGTLIYWNGTTWTDGSSVSVPNATIHAIDILGPLDNSGPLISNWSES